jgi:hypothetical protein
MADKAAAVEMALESTERVTGDEIAARGPASAKGCLMADETGGRPPAWPQQLAAGRGPGG